MHCSYTGIYQVQTYTTPDERLIHEYPTYLVHHVDRRPFASTSDTSDKSDENHDNVNYKDTSEGRLESCGSL